MSCSSSQRSDASEAQTCGPLGLEPSTLTLIHWAPSPSHLLLFLVSLYCKKYGPRLEQSDQGSYVNSMKNLALCALEYMKQVYNKQKIFSCQKNSGKKMLHYTNNGFLVKEWKKSVLTTYFLNS